MQGVEIKGAEYPIKDIFSDRFVFEIPAYQRAYSWGTEQATELITDLVAAMEDSDPKAPDPYFLGSIVLAKEATQPEAKVIDGQQRLTTLTLLLAAVADRVSDAKAQQLWVFLRQAANEFSGADEIPRLTLRSRDAGFFRDYVQQPGALPHLLDLDSEQLENDAQRNIRANAAVFVEHLAKLDEPMVGGLAHYLLNACFLVAVSTPDRDSAYRIFAILNDRGLDLTHADIIKNEVVGTIADEDQVEQYTKKWEDAEDELGTELFGDLFSHIRTIYAKTKMRGTILKEFREHVLSNVEDPRNFIDDVVSPYADVYARILTQSWETVAQADEINRWLEWLNRIDNFDWIPPAMVFLEAHRNEPQAVESFLRRLERLAASMFIRRVGVNPRIERYGRLLQELEDGVDVLGASSALDLSPEEQQETRDRLNGDVYTSGRPRLYVLLRLDESLSAGGASYDHKIITVEHVLPQHPAPDSTWVETFTEEAREHWTHRLANLVLLPRRKNSQAQNYDFELKKQKYFSGSGGSSPFVLTTQVLERDEWAPTVLENRQTHLLERLCEVWQLDGAPHPHG